MPDCNILSLDGGGSWALIQVLALKALYETEGQPVSGHDVLRKFQMVVANSGGSIVLAALALNWSLDTIADVFRSEKKRRLIFRDLPWYSDWSKLLGFGARYQTDAKLAGLRELLTGSDIALSDLPAQIGPNAPDLIITAFDYDRRREVFFRSNPSSPSASFPRGKVPVSLAEAVHASTNAPVNYFDKPAEFGGRRYWDGAVGGYNNPVLAAVTEALAAGVPHSSIRALCIGTGNVVLPIKDESTPASLAQLLEKPTLLHDVKEMASSVLDDPPDAASYVAHVMLGQRLPTREDDCVADSSVIRMNPLVQPARDGNGWRLPTGISESEFLALRNLDMDAVQNADVELIEKFCNAWLAGGVPNQPIRANNLTFRPEIGHATFAAARAAWFATPPSPAQPIA